VTGARNSRRHLAGQLAAPVNDERLLDLHDALDRLAIEGPMAARIVEARVFAALSVDEAATALGLSRATACREWTFAPRLAGNGSGREFQEIVRHFGRAARMKDIGSA
jgi:hypothetical protein